VNLPFLIVNILALGYSLRFSYFWWFQADEYVKMNKRKRREYRKKLFFMPQVMLFDFYNQNPGFEIGLNRGAGLIFLLATVLGIVVAVHGPLNR
jgi:hypothetical protein